MGLAKDLLKKLKPTLNQRIRALEYTEKNSESKIELISGREDVLTLLRDYPSDARLKNLLNRFNQKIGF